MKVKRLHLFLIKNTTFTEPVFYVEAPDILEATRIAREIVNIVNNEKAILSISEVDNPFLCLEDE